MYSCWYESREFVALRERERGRARLGAAVTIGNGRLGRQVKFWFWFLYFPPFFF